MYSVLSFTRDALASRSIRPLMDMIRMNSSGTIASATIVSAASILTITVNIPPSSTSDASTGKKPFIAMVWTENVSYVIRTIRSPISRRR